MFSGGLHLQVTDPDHGFTFPVLVQYPTELDPKAGAGPVMLGPYPFDMSLNAPVSGEHLPLVLISHGGGSSHLLFRTLSTALSQAGYVVAMVEHYGNNRNNNALNDTNENLKLRPRHIRLTIDALLAHETLAPRLNPDKIALIGHSMGGYTGMAAAGGRPNTRFMELVTVEREPRLKALVLMAPALAYFLMPGALHEVSIPVMVLSGEHDPVAPPVQIEHALKSLPDASKLNYQRIANAGHFSFLSPFPPALKTPQFPPANDPPGFDREALHASLPGEVIGFLQRWL